MNIMRVTFDPNSLLWTGVRVSRCESGRKDRVFIISQGDE